MNDYDPPRPTREGERWAWIPGFEDLYAVSTTGEARSWARKGGPRALKPTWFGRGNARRLRLGLHREGRATSLALHRAVLLAFVGAPAEGFEGCHNDGDPNNNELSNLRWDTRLGNSQDRDRHGRTPRGEAHRSAKLTAAKVVLIRERSMRGHSDSALSREFGVSRGCIHFIRTGRTWKSLPWPEVA